jgi:ABC-type ATPase with predicted acetyltransferase domain
MKFQIRKLDLTTLRPGQVLLFCGRRGSGKSHCLRFIMHAMRDQFDLRVRDDAHRVESGDVSGAHASLSGTVYNELREDVVANMLRLNRELALTNKQKSILLVF